MLGGVCGGAAEYFETDSSLIRILTAIAVIMSSGTLLLLYLLLWIVIPSDAGEHQRQYYP